MVRLAVIFLVIALAAALCGFGFVSGLAFDAAKLLFFVFIVLAIDIILRFQRGVVDASSTCRTHANYIIVRCFPCNTTAFLFKTLPKV
jgi:uncharacterized membrane protein YtjA (UPF0391 family)